MFHRFEYPLPDPPKEFKVFEEMTLHEAQEHFEWFLGLSGPRRDLLVRAFSATGGRGQLDYTPDSLIPLWTWAIPLFETKDPTPDELARRLAEGPEWVRRADISFAELTPGTVCLCMDIGFYVAEIFIRRHPDLHWALWLKKTGPYNRPYLRGFPGAPLVPVDLVAGCAWMVTDGNRTDRLLLENYEHWEAELD